ncbi:L-threonine synthase [Asanoa ferruginea]|uniref:L-threonine synthase n=1 Tax=Asanoa ferruginea TaxID=53367 RepID=A0A3D9ZWE2_9ACTN|nr:pyridoxal-phosphate dependent enzyme [Asanoa ferruginea]REG01557.1 L-threonine synthase [Asanoa ferruginea]GIF51518.1 threonine synthase [Asanoa ferruginea]
MTLPVRLRCVLCEQDRPATVDAHVCPEHEGLAGILDVVVDNPRRGTGDDPLDRYRSHLPLPATPRVLPTGYLTRTPLLPAPRLATLLGVGELLIKDESRNPTGSLKDRSSALAVELAVYGGYTDIACASTGNAASSLAGACAVAGLTARIFVPVGTPVGKLAQLAAFGAQVMLVRGSYDDAYYLCEDAARAFGWYDRNCAVNPYLMEGKKTCGLELADQLGDARADWVSVAVGDGCTVAAIGKGLAEGGHGDTRLLAVQPAGAAPIVDAWVRNSEEITAIEAHTVADSVSVGRPRNAVKALRTVRASGGAFRAVDDADIEAAARLLGRIAGFFAEPGAAAGIAAIQGARAEGLIGPHDRVVHVVTGSGLKTTARTATPFPEIEATLDAVRAVVDA